MTFYTYILASQKNGTIYIGVTNNVLEHVRQHKEKKISGFTKQYDVNMLVHYEEFQYVYDAIAREKQLKNWKRAWKMIIFMLFEHGISNIRTQNFGLSERGISKHSNSEFRIIRT